MGGTPTHFFRSAISVKSRASPKNADERVESDTFFSECHQGQNSRKSLFFGAPLASIESRASPKKAGGWGVTPTHFFGAPSASKVAQVPKKLMGGGGTTTSFESRASPKKTGGWGGLRHIFGAPSGSKVAQVTFFGAPLASKVAQVQKNWGGGGTTDTFFSERHQRRKSRKSQFFRSAISFESRTSPKKAGGWGGLRHIFGAPSASKVAQVPKMLMMRVESDTFFSECHQGQNSRKSLFSERH